MGQLAIRYQPLRCRVDEPVDGGLCIFYDPGREHFP